MKPISRRHALGAIGAATVAAWLPQSRAQSPSSRVQSWPLNAASRTGIHDVAPAPDGGVWYSAQASGHLGYFDPKTGKNELVDLGSGSKPHGVVQGPDKAAWLTDGGQQAMVRVSWPGREVRKYSLPEGAPYANLNTCAFDADGDCWFTGQSGIYGKVAVKSGQVTTWDAPKGRGPYGICATPSGDIWYCSLAGSFIARIDRASGESKVVEPPTKGQGARRVWSDSRGRIWVSEWMSGQLSMYDPSSKAWKAWMPPQKDAHTYAVYVDDRDQVWISEWTGNAMYRFDPATEKFERFDFPRAHVRVRQILGRPGEVWLPESGTEYISVIRSS
jgi:virginiamycin B lyase